MVIPIHLPRMLQGLAVHLIVKSAALTCMSTAVTTDLVSIQVEELYNSYLYQNKTYDLTYHYSNHGHGFTIIYDHETTNIQQ